MWFVSFVWLNETYQMNQINQINKTNRSTRRAMLDEDGLFEQPARSNFSVSYIFCSSPRLGSVFAV